MLIFLLLFAAIRLIDLYHYTIKKSIALWRERKYTRRKLTSHEWGHVANAVLIPLFILIGIMGAIQIVAVYPVALNPYFDIWTILLHWWFLFITLRLSMF